MAKRSNNRRQPVAKNILQIRDLHVYYGRSHALQGVYLTLEKGVFAVVGRNGMGKTTLCKAIMGLAPVQRGSIKFEGQEIVNMAAWQTSSLGIGYTPQGRRLWPSLTVDEHLRLVEFGGSWTVARIYETFPRLAERRRSGAGQLSGGEQQMLAISRALLQDPQLLILDEPTEGLAPLIVEQVEKLLNELASEQDVSVLLIEQNISVATAVAKDIAVMVNGRIGRIFPAEKLAGDRILQEQLLGVGRHSHEDFDLPASPESEPASTESRPENSTVLQLSSEDEQDGVDEKSTDSTAYVPPMRWSNMSWSERADSQPSSGESKIAQVSHRPFDTKLAPLLTQSRVTLASPAEKSVYVAGTFDTKGTELRFIRNCIADHGLAVKTIDLSTSDKLSSADVPPHVIAAYHPDGSGAKFSGDRGASVRAMAQAFERYIQNCHDIAGIISAAGSGGTALATPAMRTLPIGIPKVMISTVASGDVAEYVGSSDIMMMYSVTDIQGLNRISRQVLANGANALAGMVTDNLSENGRRASQSDKPGLAMTMFGVTTPAVQQIIELVQDRYDCLVLHATGTGGRSMEKLVDSGMIVAAIDLTTTEVCDMFMGGVFAADENRFGSFIRSRIPWVGSVGALDMVNFGPRNTVPDHYRDRNFVEHNPQVTLMRTTESENRQMAEWIADRINLMTGPVRFLIPEGGVSALDAPGQPFYDPQANQALFDTITARFQETGNRRLIRTPHHINDPAFAEIAVNALQEINPTERALSYGTI